MSTMNMLAAVARKRVAGGGPSTEFLTSGAGTGLRNDLDATLGMIFSLSTEINVTELGRWVVLGNSGSHAIGIWNSSGTLLGSVTVNTAGASVGYLYATLGSPVTLPVDTGYRIGSLEVNGGDEYYNEFPVTTTAVGSVANSCFGFGSILTFPSLPSTAGWCFVPANFKYT